MMPFEDLKALHSWRIYLGAAPFNLKACKPEMSHLPLHSWNYSHTAGCTSSGNGTASFQTVASFSLQNI